MTLVAHERLGRNDPCPCGSGKKYKVCHLAQDQAVEAAKRDQESASAAQESHPEHHCDSYKPQTHKVAAISRPDFLVKVRNLAATGAGSWLHIESPTDLGRDQASVDAALTLLGKHGVVADFRLDPAPPVIDAVGELLDRMCGRGVFTVRPSGARLRRYGRSEIVPANEGSGFIAYLGGDQPEAVVSLIIAAVARDGEALGIEDGLIADMWPVARVLREMVVNYLALPSQLRESGTPIVTALVDQIAGYAANIADDPEGDLALAVTALVYRLALREAVDDPRRQLEGMGLEPIAVEAVAGRLEAAASSPGWVLQLVDLAGDAWETAEGYDAWVIAAHHVPEVAGMLDRRPGGDVAAVVQEPERIAAREQSAPAGGPLLQSAPDAIPVATKRTELTGAASLFADVDRVADEYSLRRKAVQDHLDAILDRSEANTRRQRELSHELADVAAEAKAIVAEQSTATHELEEVVDAEARARLTTLMAVLAQGSAELAHVAAAWSDAIDPADGSDRSELVAAQRMVREYAEMERDGLIERLPPGLRGDLEQNVRQARERIREALGGRDPLVLPAVVAANEEEGDFTLSLCLPFRGGDELAPGALQTAVATAIAGVVVDVVQSMPQLDVAAIEHVMRDEGVSVLRVRFSGQPEVAAEVCAAYCANVLGDVGLKSSALREAAVSFDVRVEPHLGLED
jgi:hypothetical protein